MKKGQSFFVIILVLIILGTMYIALDNIFPLVINMFQDTSLFYNYNINKYSTTEASDTKEKIIAYEYEQRLNKIFPYNNLDANVYYTIYGKRVLETDDFLDLSDVTIDDNLEKNLELLTNIKVVNLYNQNLSKEEKIKLIEKFPNIEFKWKVDILGEEIEYNIETLDFSNRTITDINDFKKSLVLLTNLKKLDLSNSNLTNEELGALREEFPNIKIDWVVHMSKWSVRTDAVAFSVLVYKYDYRRMTTEDIQVLKYCTDLQALDLGHQAIEDISVIGEYLPNLRVLILADNKIKDISPLANLKHLHYLELFMNDITDSSPLASCTELVDLNISFNYRFSDISGIMNLPKLERLWLISDRISAESYNLIRQTYPNVKLVTTGSGSTNSGWRTHERYYTMIDMYKNNYISDVFLKYDNE